MRGIAWFMRTKKIGQPDYKDRIRLIKEDYRRDIKNYSSSVSCTLYDPGQKKLVYSIQTNRVVLKRTFENISREMAEEFLKETS